MNEKETTKKAETSCVRSVHTGATGHYAPPRIEVIELETSQNILGGSLPSSEGEPWIP